jgi:hypothetical protein
MAVKADRILAPAPGVKVEVIDGECLLYHPQHARAFYLNPSAAMIWGLFDGVRPFHDVCRLIAEAYPDAPEGTLLDVTMTVNQLKEHGVLIEAQGP